MAQNSPSSVDQACETFLSEVFPSGFGCLLSTSQGDHSDVQDHARARPFVTLTYAQSLDAKIAGRGGKQLRISGEESMRMTHQLRRLHDGILVGVGTVLNDNPQLNVRIPEPLPPYLSPRPIVLDTSFRTPVTCKLITNHKQGKGRQPWVVGGPGNAERRDALRAAGARTFEVERDVDGKLSLPSVLRLLTSPPSADDEDDADDEGRPIIRLMVEGGASIISAFLSSATTTSPSTANRKPTTTLVDRLIVTVAPTLVGRDGIAVLPGTAPASYTSDSEDGQAPRLKHIASRAFGNDTVMACKVNSDD